MGEDGVWRFLEKDSHILDSMHRAFLQMQGDGAKSDEDLSWVLKVYVNKKARPRIRLKYKGTIYHVLLFCKDFPCDIYVFSLRHIVSWQIKPWSLTRLICMIKRNIPSAMKDF